VSLKKTQSPAKVTEFDGMSFRIQQQILWFDVTMTDAKRVDVRKTSEQLIHVQLDAETQTQTHTSFQRQLHTKWFDDSSRMTIYDTYDMVD